MSRRSFIILLSISVLTIGFIVYFVFFNKKQENKTDDYTDWKVYQSSYSGLKFKYPSDWSVKDTSFSDRELITDLDSTADKVDIFDNEGNKHLVFSSYDIDPSITTCDKDIKPGEVSQIPDADLEGEYLYGCSDVSVLSSVPIPNIKGLYYIEGIITSDNESYTPVCGITNDNTQETIKTSYYSPWFISDKSKNLSNSKRVQFACKSDDNDSNLTGLYSIIDTKDAAISEIDKDYFQNIRKILLSLEYI